MIIEDPETRERFAGVGLGLTPDEARELHDAIEVLLEDPQDRHEHGSSSDYQTELTIWIAGQISGRDDD